MDDKGGLSMDMDCKTFVAMDFETANPKRVSACSVGGCVIEGNVITDSFSTLIKPPSEFGEFAPMNVRIHGITPDRVADAPTFGDLFPKFRKRVEGRVIISYSKFDLSVINSLLDYYGQSSSFEHIDVCKMARECLPGLPNYKLPTVAKCLGLGDFNHHDAAEDARMCAKIFLSLLQTEATGRWSRTAQKKESFSDAFNGFASTIVEDGIVDYKEAVELMWFLDVLPSQDVVKRLRQSVSDFLADGEITSEESDILILQLGIAAKKFAGKTYVVCPDCGGPLSDGAQATCPWCLAHAIQEYETCDDIERHLAAIAQDIG